MNKCPPPNSDGAAVFVWCVFGFMIASAVNEFGIIGVWHNILRAFNLIP